MGIAFKDTGCKLRDGVIPAGTTVWKKLARGQIVEMITLEAGLIPTALRHQVQSKTSQIAKTTFGNDNARKCRAPKVYVVAISDYIGDAVTEGFSHVGGMRYAVGEVVVPDGYDANPNKVCTNGIHCFLSKAEAKAYRL